MTPPLFLSENQRQDEESEEEERDSVPEANGDVSTTCSAIELSENGVEIATSMTVESGDLLDGVTPTLGDRSQAPVTHSTVGTSVRSVSSSELAKGTWALWPENNSRSTVSHSGDRAVFLSDGVENTSGDCIIPVDES